MPCARQRSREPSGNATRPASRWSPSAATAVASWPRTATSTWSWSTDDIADADLAEVAGTVWYPLWDAGAALDHSVRALSEVTAAASSDIRVALGLLDARHLAGDPTSPCSCAPRCWPSGAATRGSGCPSCGRWSQRRGERLGELAHASVPDLKESGGGLRDATVLKALVATWLVDVPHADLERCRQQLLDVRDALHEVAGRPLGPGRPRDVGRPGRHARGSPTPTRRSGRSARSAAASPTSPGSPGAGSEGVLARPVSGAHRRRPDLEPVGSSASRCPTARSSSTGVPGPPTTRRCCSAPRRRPPSAT